MIRWLQNSKIAAGIMLLMRLYLGYYWLVSGIGKFTKGFDASGYLKGAIANPVMSTAGDVQYPLYVSFLKNIALPMSDVVNIVIPVMEVAVGALLIVGMFTSIAASVGMLLNFMFLFAGTISVNPIFIVFGIFLAGAGMNGGLIGIDGLLAKKHMPRFLELFNYYDDEHKKSAFNL